MAYTCMACAGTKVGENSATTNRCTECGAQANFIAHFILADLLKNMRFLGAGKN